MLVYALTFHQKMKGKHFLLDRNNGCRHDHVLHSPISTFIFKLADEIRHSAVSLWNISLYRMWLTQFSTHTLNKIKEHLAGKTTHNNRERGHCVAFCRASQRWLPFSVFLCPLHLLCNCLFPSLALSESSTRASFVSGSSSSFSRHFPQLNTHNPI